MAEDTDVCCTCCGMPLLCRHVWESDTNKVVLYATHDCSPSGHGDCVAETAAGGDGNTTVTATATATASGAPADDLKGAQFRMTDWWVWSSTDLVNWKMETKVLPSTLSWVCMCMYVHALVRREPHYPAGVSLTQGPLRCPPCHVSRSTSLEAAPATNTRHADNRGAMPMPMTSYTYAQCR